MQGFNMGRYIPPEHEGVLTANQSSGKGHALGARARKSAQGILTVRFEMPFAVWCTTCQPEAIIGQGVRFNAEKRRVGAYLSTPVWAFRMKHGACGGAIEVRTDPKNTAYVVTEGGRKRDTGEGKEGEEGEVVIRTEEERERLRADAFAALEQTIEDRRAADAHAERIGELQRARTRDWRDPYEANRRLRRGFRVERKAREREEGVKEGVRERMGLAIELLDVTEEDRRRAGLVEFERVDEGTAVGRAAARPLFAEQGGATKGSEKGGKRKKQEEVMKRREMLHRELRSNTRAAVDPFLEPMRDKMSSNGVAKAVHGIKRKRPQAGNQVSGENNPAENNSGATSSISRQGLVDYDSD